MLPEMQEVTNGNLLFDISIRSSNLGIDAVCLEVALKYANKRKTFGQFLSKPVGPCDMF